MSVPAWTYVLPLIAINVCASLLLKVGAADKPAWLLLHILSWRSFLGLACFGLGGLAYAIVLRYVALSVAQALLTSQYAFTVLGAWLLLHEHIDAVQWVGFVLIGLGIGLVVWRL
ncbi:MAG: EamA family transporter [Desulfovibrio sp.]|nr:EamA family transporter [Desulfovibrio sp.]